MAIGVIALLLGLALPSLAGARGQARQVKCLSNLRGVAAVMELYTQANRDRYPFAASDQWLDTTPPEEAERGRILDGNVFNKLKGRWVAVVAEVAPWREWFATWVCPGSPRAVGKAWECTGDGNLSGQSSYTYSHAFSARPDVWLPDAPPNTSFIAPVALGDVSFQARKVIFFDNEMAHLPPNADKDNRPMLFADGHAALHRLSQAAKPVVNPFTKQAEPLHDTALGVRGYDY